jgi:hypothetical protein
MSISNTATTIPKLNKHNYQAWVLDMQDVLKQLSLWRIVNGTERVPIPPQKPGPEEYDAVKYEKYLRKYERYELEQDQYDEKRTKACGTICLALEPSIGHRYRALKYHDPRVLWETNKSDFEKVTKRDGQHEQQKLATCKLGEFPSVTEWGAA